MRTVYRVRGIVGWALWLVGITGFGMAQGVGEHVTAGFNAQRTYLNSNAGTAVFQVKNDSNALFEAGVSDSVPTGLAHVFVDRVQLAGSSFSTGIPMSTRMTNRRRWRLNSTERRQQNKWWPGASKSVPESTSRALSNSFSGLTLIQTWRGPSSCFRTSQWESQHYER